MYIQTAGGFDWMLCLSIMMSLGSSALCFVYLDMNDHRFGRDRLHQAELAALFCYRTAELSARITLLALFAVSASKHHMEDTLRSGEPACVDLRAHQTWR
jgi:hypothetical protein